MRIHFIRASEEWAAFIFKYRHSLIVDDIDPWIDCVWFA